MKHFLIVASICLCPSLFAQKTLSLGDNTSPRATLDQMAWMAGYWTGEAFGGITEELWSPPNGDSMMGAFRLINGDKVNFYEMCQIRQEGETLMLRIKHFHGDLKGWEKQDETVDFPLVKIDGNTAYFDGWTIKKLSDNDMVMYVNIDSEGSQEEVEFKYSRKSLK